MQLFRSMPGSNLQVLWKNVSEHQKVNVSILKDTFILAGAVFPTVSLDDVAR